MDTVTALEPSHAPFFVIGSPRSGTTLLRLMLASHPRLVIPPECGFITWLYPTFGDWQSLDFSNPEKIKRFVGTVIASRKFETWGISANQLTDAINQHHPRDYGEACALGYRIFCEHAGKPLAIWGDKNNYYLSQIEILRAIFSQARFIHIVRDGRDIACSYREVMSIDTDSPYRPELPLKIDEIAKQWAMNIQTIRQSFSELNSSKVFELRYEDLVADPQGTLTNICSWLGVGFSSDMLQFHKVNRIHRLEPTATLDWKRRTLEPVKTSAVGRYKRQLMKSEIDTFEFIAHLELGLYGYTGENPQFIR